MLSDSPCPSPDVLRRSLDPDDPMPEQQRLGIESHVDHCDRGCKEAIEAVLRGATLALTAGGAEPNTRTGPGEPAVASVSGSPAQPPAPPGYEILGELGRGGMGVVYKARQIALNRVVALKMILAGAHASADDLARFRTEAEAVAALQHPNIVQIHEIGGHDGCPYFSLEFVAGGNLARMLAGAPQPPAQAAVLVETLARAVHFAHRQGVLHRDLKPANVLLTADGAPKVADFGLAKRLEGPAHHTQSGVVMGTPSYMAPEQAAGRSKEVGPATDVYALGAILYEMLTGRPPFQAPNAMDALVQVIQNDPVPPGQHQSKIPRELEAICLKCLEKDPARRYARAEDLADDLRHFQRHEPILARPVGPWRRAVKWARRRPGVAMSLAAAVVSLVGGIVASTSFALVANDRANQLEKSRRDRAQAEVDALLNASPGAVPAILQSLRLDRAEVLPRLRELWDDGDLSDRRRQRVALALLPVDPRLADYLYEHLPDAEPDDARVLIQQLAGHKEELTERLWAMLEQPDKGHEDRRLRAAAALAAYDPDGPRWDGAAGQVARQLVAVDPAYLGAWKEALRPVREKLLAPLAAVFRDHTDERGAERSLATSVLADFAADRPAVLADLLMDADEKQFMALFSRVEANPESVAAALRETLRKVLEAERTEDAKENLAKRQANAAAALLRLGEPEAVWPLLRRRPDPRIRSYIIHYLGPRGAKAANVVQRLDEETDVSVRRALLLTLGEFDAEGLSPEVRDRLLPKVQRLYREDPDAGLHGAAGWLLRQWGKEDALKEIDRPWADDRRGRDEKLEQIRKGLAEASGRREPADVRAPGAFWYVNSQGQTMVVVPESGEPFLMGSPPTTPSRVEVADEKQVEKRIGRSFAVAAREVTVEQFLRFRKSHNYNKQYSPAPDCPVNRVTWYQAAEYCNWLTQQELPEGPGEDQRCYLPNENGEYAAGMRLKPDHLRLTGYRLPTEAEWEFACRAGATTSRYYGEKDDLLEKYAWYTKTSLDRRMLPVGGLKPNDLGLFDMLGNALEWCESADRPYADGEDEDDAGLVTDESGRILRGASFNDHPEYTRSAMRYRFPPTLHDLSVGFRPARTFR